MEMSFHTVLESSHLQAAKIPATSERMWLRPKVVVPQDGGKVWIRGDRRGLRLCR